MFVPYYIDSCIEYHPKVTNRFAYMFLSNIFSLGKDSIDHLVKTGMAGIIM